MSFSSSIPTGNESLLRFRKRAPCCSSDQASWDWSFGDARTGSNRQHTPREQHGRAPEGVALPFLFTSTPGTFFLSLPEVLPVDLQHLDLVVQHPRGDAQQVRRVLLDTVGRP